MVPMPGCRAQIQEMVLCCGSTACVQPLSMLCAQHWSYPLLSLGERVSVTMGDTSSGILGVVSSHLMYQQLPLPLASHRAIPQSLMPSISSILHGSAFMADWEGDFQFLFSLGN